MTTRFEAVTTKLGQPESHIYYADTREECASFAKATGRGFRIREVVWADGRATGYVVRTASGTVVGGEDVQCFPFADTDESDDVE